MIGFCFTCHGSWRSEARVSLSVVVCATGDVTGSLDHSDPAYYSLQTICFYTSLHSWTCRSWNEVFFFSCLVSFNTSLKTVGFKYLVFECCVDCVGGKKEGQKANSTSATMALLQCKHLLLRDLSQLYIYDQNLSNPEYSSLQHHTTAQQPHNYSILIKVKPCISFESCHQQKLTCPNGRWLHSCSGQPPPPNLVIWSFKYMLA